MDTLVILGPTGSGKTGVSIQIAKKIGGEIISADSRAIFRGMDIGTAKPSIAEREGVSHFGFDLANPNERFTVADWKAYTESRIREIKARKHVPMVVGGTGLYIDSLIFDYHFKGPTGAKIGDIEQKSCSDRTEVKPHFMLIGVKTDTEELRARLKARADQMFCPELFEETKKLVEKYDWDCSAMKSNIYRYVTAFLSGEMDLGTAKKQAFYADWHLAKRQLTWFKRNPAITWLDLSEIYSYVVCHYSENNTESQFSSNQ